MSKPLKPKVTRDSGFLGRMKTRVAPIAGHPIHQGVKMQAHHLISCEGMKLSKLGSVIKRSGYNINHHKNLVFLPSTLQGACHLQVQLHRGNHTASAEDDDGEHPDSYHKMVAKEVIKLETFIKKQCPGKGKGRREKVIEVLNNRSLRILGWIDKAPAQARLTRLYNHFQPKSDVGCSNVDNIPNVPKTNAPRCGVDRNHLNHQNADQRAEQIQYNAVLYTLTVGE